jgi:hypothetical protein
MEFYEKLHPPTAIFIILSQLFSILIILDSHYSRFLMNQDGFPIELIFVNRHPLMVQLLPSTTPSMGKDKAPWVFADRFSPPCHSWTMSTNASQKEIHMACCMRTAKLKQSCSHVAAPISHQITG